MGQEQVVGPCKYGNEPSGCIKYRNFSTKYETVKFSRRPHSLVNYVILERAFLIAFCG